MTMPTTFYFDGYDGLVRGPLEQTDPRSFALVNSLLEKAPDSPGTCPFGFLIQTLSSVAISPNESRRHWSTILEHKRRLELKLCRAVNIRTACIDYYDQLGVDAPLSVTHPADINSSGAVSALSGAVQKKTGVMPPERTAVYQERLKEEMMRARRYKHALSVILFDVDPGGTAAETADKALTVIMKLINKAVRTVDILARHAYGRFLLMLPNTNKREALELAGRLKNSIGMRIGRLPECAPGSIRIIIALGQYGKEDTAADFIGRLERLAERGARSAPTDIHVLG
ncbi:MAG: diguanylate cyclase [Chitinispirillaceae bacterium]|nr:diguanylate cyclase [Chitinispirillaceae bacterium]